MNTTKKSFFSRKYRQIFMALAAVIAFVVLGSRFGDPQQNQVENFVLSSSELKRSIGAIERLDLVKTLDGENNGDYGNAGEPGRKLYLFDAHGITGTRKVLVSVRKSSSGHADSIRIENIE